VEDRSGGRVNVMSAVIAGVGWTAYDAVMLRYSLAQLAVDPFRVKEIPEPFQTCGIIRKHLLEVLECKAFHLRSFIGFFHLVHGVPTLATFIVPDSIPTVKG